jgi:multidrug resistance efflux pump
MSNLERQLDTLQRQLKTLRAQTEKARGEAQSRLTDLERQARGALERALRGAEPTMRRAMVEATAIARGLKAGVKAGVSAYRAGGRKR